MSFQLCVEAILIEIAAYRNCYYNENGTLMPAEVSQEHSWLMEGIDGDIVGALKDAARESNVPLAKEQAEFLTRAYNDARLEYLERWNEQATGEDDRIPF